MAEAGGLYDLARFFCLSCDNRLARNGFIGEASQCGRESGMVVHDSEPSPTVMDLSFDEELQR